MKRILFIVNGLGLGNSTRCEAIIESLVDRGVLVDILTSNNGVYYFKRQNYPSNVYEFHGFYYGRKGSKLSVWRTLMAIPHFAWICLKNVRLLAKLLRTNNYTAIVIDSDYTMFWLKKRTKTPIFAVNNADMVVAECRRLHSLPKEIRMQYLIERCDHWFHSKVPNKVLSPCLSNGTRDGAGPWIHFAPFIRSGLMVRPPDPRLRNILVMLSGSQFKTNASLILERFNRPEGVKVDVVGQEGESNEWVTFHGKLRDNKKFINKADMMVVNGGFSAVSEAVVLRKPLVVIPVPNHAEQYINGRLVEEFGLGLSANMENVVAKISEMVCRFATFVEAHQRFNVRNGGAQEAARAICHWIEHEC